MSTSPSYRKKNGQRFYALEVQHEGRASLSEEQKHPRRPPEVLAGGKRVRRAAAPCPRVSWHGSLLSLTLSA